MKRWDIEIINLTPHEVRVFCPVIVYDGIETKDYGKDTVVYASEGLVRISVKMRQIDVLDGIAIVEQEFGEPVGLPEEELNEDGEPLKYYIVSQLVKQALPHRRDLLFPADLVRDQDGNVIGCNALGR